MVGGQIPNDIVDMLHQGMRESKNPRTFKTEVINKLFNRDESGKLVMCPHAPFFTAWKQTKDIKTMTHRETAMPKTVFMGKFFNNSEEALKNSVAVGYVEMVKVNGKEFYSFVSLENAHTKAKEASQKVLQTEKKIGAATSQHLTGAFDSLDFNFKRICNSSDTTVHSSSGTSASGSSSAVVAVEVQPPLTGDEVFEKMRDVFEDAKGATERIGREILKLVSKTGDDPKTTGVLFFCCNTLFKCSLILSQSFTSFLTQMPILVGC